MKELKKRKEWRVRRIEKEEMGRANGMGADHLNDCSRDLSDSWVRVIEEASNGVDTRERGDGERWGVLGERKEDVLR